MLGISHAISKRLTGRCGETGRAGRKANFRMIVFHTATLSCYITINDEALTEGERLLSSYGTAKGGKVWATTESDRSVTALLLPEEY